MNAQQIHDYMLKTLDDDMESTEFDLPTVAQIEEHTNGRPHEPVPDETYDPVTASPATDELNRDNRVYRTGEVLYCYSGDYHMWSHFRFVTGKELQA